MDFLLFQSARMALTVILGAYLALDLWRLNRAGPAFAIQQLQIDPASERVLFLHGRGTGIRAWLYTRLGLDADARLELTEADIRIQRQSLKGFELFYAPTHDLSSSSCGYYRAVSLVLIAISLLVSGYGQLVTAWQLDNPYERQVGLEIAGNAAIFGSIAAVVAYWLFDISKRITISVETKGGLSRGIALKRNVIDNVTVGLPESVKAVDMLNQVILRASGGGGLSIGSGPYRGVSR